MNKRDEVKKEIDKLTKKLDTMPKSKVELMQEEIDGLNAKIIRLELKISILEMKENWKPFVPLHPWTDYSWFGQTFYGVDSADIGTDVTVYSI